MTKDTSLLSKNLKNRTSRIVMFRSLQVLLYSLVLIAVLILALIAIAYFKPSWILFSLHWKVLLAAFVGVPLLLGGATFIYQVRDTDRLTVVIERRYPRLRDRLLTALEFSGPGASQKPTDPISQMFARGLEKEMTSLLSRFSFTRVTSFRQLTAPTTLLIFMILIAGLIYWAQPNFFREGYLRLSNSLSRQAYIQGHPGGPVLPKFEVQVAPGDCEVPRGSRLSIHARSVNYTAEGAELLIKYGKQSTWQIFSMDLMEEDSFQVLLPHVLEEAVYFVKMDHQESKHFRIKLYEPFGIEEAVWKIQYPDYLKMQTQSKNGWPTKLPVTVGSRVELTLKMNRPASDR